MPLVLQSLVPLTAHKVDEIIRKLAVRADAETSARTGSTEYMQKFAELIIEEFTRDLKKEVAELRYKLNLLEDDMK